MADLATLENALRKADAAGDAAGAKVLADEIRRMQSATPAPSAPATVDVAGNAAMKGLAQVPDFFLNLRTHAGNLGKWAYGQATGEQPSYNEAPDLARKGLSAVGLIDPAKEPQTPGQRILDKSIQGGIGFGLMPGRAVVNAGLGLVTGGTSGAVKELTGSDAAEVATGLLTPFGVRGAAQVGQRRVAEAATKEAQNVVRDNTLADAQQAGYKVPPSSVNPSFLNNRLESVAGKAAVKQDAALRNQEVTNTLVAKELGLPPETALTPGKLEKYREAAAQPYREVAALSPNAKTALDMLKQARHDASAHYKHYERSADPSALAKAKQFDADVQTLDGMIAQEAQAAGRPELVQALAEARAKIAKSYDVERALNVGDASVDARAIGRMLDQGKPLGGNLKTIGAFAEGPGRQVTREAAAVPSPGVSGTDAFASAILGTIGAGHMGAPGILAGGLPLLRAPARNLALSRFWQGTMAQPNYNQGSLLSQLPDNSLPTTAAQSAVMAQILQDRR